MDAERKARTLGGADMMRDDNEQLRQTVALLTQRLEAAERAIRDLSSEIAGLSDAVAADRPIPDDTPPPVFRSAASRAAAASTAPTPTAAKAAAPARPAAQPGSVTDARRRPNTGRPGATRHPLASESTKAPSGGRGWAIGASLIVLVLAGAAGWWYGFGRDEWAGTGDGAATVSDTQAGASEGETDVAAIDTIAPTPDAAAAPAEAIGPTPTPEIATPEIATPEIAAPVVATDEAAPPAEEPTVAAVTVDVGDDEASPDSIDDPDASQPEAAAGTAPPETPGDAPAVTPAPTGETDVAVLPPAGTTAAAPSGAAAAPALPDNASPEVVRLAELATQGNANAQHDLATAYALGNGVPRDYTTAAYWYKRAADAGMLNAIFNLGVLTDNGWGVERNPAEAFQLYLSAAEKGHPDAQTAVGLAYEQGYGTAADPIKAASWFKAASTNGNPRGAFYLGKLYERGLNGAPDLAQAAGWYQIAAEHGVAEAKDALDRLTSTGTTPTAGSDLVPADAPPPVATDGSTPPDAGTIAAAMADKTELDPAGLKELQTLLAGMGLNPGPADGMMGSRTRQAIDAFAAKIDVPSPNPPTRGLLEAARLAAAQG